MLSHPRKGQAREFAVTLKTVQLSDGERETRVRKAFDVIFDAIWERQIQKTKEADPKSHLADLEPLYEG